MKVARPFRSLQRVYFDDLDALNILHNVRYLLFVERARGELFNALGFLWQDDLSTNPDKLHVVAEHGINYLRPFRGEGMLAVELSPRTLGRSSLIIDAVVCDPREVSAEPTFASQRHGSGAGSAGGDSAGGNSTPYATTFTRLVRLDPVSNRPCPWSQRFRDAITPLLPE